MSKKANQRLQKTGIYIAISFITLVLVFPFLWMVCTALKERSEMFASVPTFLPKVVTFENFRSMWFDYKFYNYLRNSVIVTFSTTLVSLLFSTFMAYGISRFRFRGRTAVFDRDGSSQKILSGKICQITGVVDRSCDRKNNRHIFQGY